MHVRAADWYADHGLTPVRPSSRLPAVDDERVERFIGLHYMELVSQGEQAWLRSWTGRLCRDLVRQPPLALHLRGVQPLLVWRAGRGRPDAGGGREGHPSGGPGPRGPGDVSAARVRAEPGHRHARRSPAGHDLCLAAREAIPGGNRALKLDTGITLGYECFLDGDYANADRPDPGPILSWAAASAL